MKPLLLAFWIICTFTARAQQPPAKGADASESPFQTVENIGAVVPSSVNLKTGGKWNVVGVEQANEAIKTKALNRPAKLRLKVAVFQPYKEQGWGYRIMAPDDDVTMRGTRVPYRVWAYFRPDQAEALSEVRVGSTVIVSGTLGRADVQMFGDRPGLSLDLHEAKVEKQ